MFRIFCFLVVLSLAHGATWECRDYLNNGLRNCCADKASDVFGLCQDSSCTVFGFPNSARANCQFGKNPNCADSYCDWTKPDCSTTADSKGQNHCYGRVACTNGATCRGLGELCLQDGNSRNFKICSEGCKSDSDCNAGATGATESCIAGECKVGCKNNKDCDDGYSCVETCQDADCKGKKVNVCQKAASASDSTNAEDDVTTCCEERPCKHQGICQLHANGKKHCKCPTGFEGNFCESGQCSEVLANYPDMKILDGGMGPSCTLGQAGDMLKPYDCVPELEGCNILKCRLPIPPAVIQGVKDSCPDQMA